MTLTWRSPTNSRAEAWIRRITRLFAVRFSVNAARSGLRLRATLHTGNAWLWTKTWGELRELLIMFSNICAGRHSSKRFFTPVEPTRFASTFNFLDFRWLATGPTVIGRINVLRS